jgi:hypothetical protein
MKIFHYHPDTKIFLGEDIADESPLEPGVWLIPAHATSKVPPSITDKEQLLWDGEDWKIFDIQILENESESNPIHTFTIDEQFDWVKRQRKISFFEESDPLFFQWQSGESDKETWLSKREEIRLRYPYPKDPLPENYVEYSDNLNTDNSLDEELSSNLTE